MRRLMFLVGLVVTSWGPMHAVAAEKRPLEIADLYRIDTPTQPLLLPDGDSLIYVREWHDAARRERRSSLWRVDGTSDNRRPLEAEEPDARFPVLSPNGRWIVFLSNRPHPDGSPACPSLPPQSDPSGDLWLLPATGGKAIPLAGVGKPYGRILGDRFYGRAAFSRDGKRLAFVADDGVDPRTAEEISNRVSIVREDQGEGYEGYGPAQIWIADLAEDPKDSAAARILRLTEDEVWYGDPQWSADGRSIVVHANRTSDRESVRYSINKNFDLWRIDVASRRLEQLTTGPGPEVSPRFSPDGRHLACLSVPRRGPHADVYNLLLVDLAENEPRSKLLFDHHALHSEGAPYGAPSFPLPDDCWLDQHRLQCDTIAGMKSRRQVIDLDQGGRVAEGSTSGEDRKQQIARLLPPGNVFLKERSAARSERVEWKSDDGLALEGVLTLPPEGIGQRPYKLLLHPHGGPHSQSAPGFNFGVHLFAAHGYAVFQPNFRGSSGYGRQFLDADRGDFGGGDVRDILTGIDHLVKEGLVDRRRQFVYGVSYGGFLTCWLVGHTNQFLAAAPQNAVTDLNAMWGLSDLQSWTEWEFSGLPWEAAEAMRRHSPLTYASRVRTPTLILHAAGDRRCPLPMGRMLYQALKKSGVETQMVVYPDEGHGIKQLPHQEDILRRVLAWFENHDAPAR